MDAAACSHVQFLGGGVAVMQSCYPIPMRAHARISVFAERRCRTPAKVPTPSPYLGSAGANRAAAFAEENDESNAPLYGYLACVTAANVMGPWPAA